MDWISALLGGAFDLIGTGINAHIQRDMQQQQNAFNLQMWNLQNEYNTPEAQMQRFQRAGLSPQLVYGNGSSGNATSAPEIGSTIPAGAVASGLDKMLNTIAGVNNLRKQEEEIRQAKIATFQGQMNAEEQAQRLSALQWLGDNTGVLSLPSPGDFNGKNPLRLFALGEYYRKLLGGKLQKEVGQGSLWKTRSQWANLGLTDKDPWWSRLLVRNMPHLDDTFKKLSGRLDSGFFGKGSPFDFLFNLY